MRKLLLCVLLFPISSLADCDFANEIDLVEGKPVIRVSPIYPRKEYRRRIEACVVLGYSLIEKPGTDGRGLIPDKIEFLHASSERSKPFVKAAKRALKKWLFLSKAHSAKNEISYYSTFSFELEPK